MPSVITTKGPVDVHNEFVEGLRSMELLRLLPLDDIQEPLRYALYRLYVLACERIENGGRDLDLVPKIARMLPNEPDAPNWVTYTDKMHTAASFGYLTEICKGENFSPEEQKGVLSAIVVHDCAYPKVGSDEYRKARAIHMEMGTDAFYQFAGIVNGEFPSTFYNSKSIEEIIAIIEQHDNPSVKDEDGKPLQFHYDPPKKELLWAHREADRLWMLDRAGFALDLLRRLAPDESDKVEYDPQSYLKHVVKRHVQEGMQAYSDNEDCIMLRENWFGFKGQKTLYRTQKGFEVFMRLVEERAKEYNVNLSE